jgi:uncharacterized protein
MALRIAPDLELPVDAVTETFAVLAVRGAGKSNAGVVMAEEMYEAGLPFVVFDPKGDWWGMRSARDGKSPGLDIPIFGAPGRKRKNKPDPDLPLEPEGGALIADLVVEERVPCILDVSGFSEAAKIKFLIGFGTRLFERNEEPLHLFLEECDDYLPQKPFKEQTRLLHIYTKILKQGRTFGLGATLISQRSAVVNKNALTQCTTLIAMRTTSTQDRAAIEGWVKDKGGTHLEIVESLPSLKAGEAWVWSPEFLKTTKKIRFRRRQTFDSGATPKVGEKTLADIDLGALQARMTETIEKAKAEDPKELRREIARLRKELTSAEQRPVPTAQPEVVRVPVMDDGDFDSLEEVANRLWGFVQELEKVLDPIKEDMGLAFGEVRGLSETIALRLDDLAKGTPKRTSPPIKSAPVAQPRRSEAPARDTEGDTPAVKAGARRILETFARHYPMKMTRSQLGVLAKFKITGGTFQTYFSQLKRLGFLVEEGGQIAITTEGLEFIGHIPQRAQTAQEIRDAWRSALKAGAVRMLDILIDFYPDSLSKTELAERCEMAESGGTFQTYLSTLRRNGLCEVFDSEVKATDILFVGA